MLFRACSDGEAGHVLLTDDDGVGVHHADIAFFQPSSLLCTKRYGMLFGILSSHGLEQFVCVRVSSLVKADARPLSKQGLSSILLSLPSNEVEITHTHPSPPLLPSFPTPRRHTPFLFSLPSTNKNNNMLLLPQKKKPKLPKLPKNTTT